MILLNELRKNREKILELAKESGVTDVCVIGAGGVEKIVEITLNSEQKAMFDKSVDAVKGICGGIKF